MNYEELADFDVFFYYGEPGSNVDTEIQSDVLAGMLQPRRTLLYNASEGAGISEKENAPLSLIIQIGIRLNIVNWISKRNSEVTDGTGGNPDRRVAISQNSIDIQEGERGFLKVFAHYFAFKDTKKPVLVEIPLTLST